MNKIYRLIWSVSQQCFVVASETAKSCTKRSSVTIKRIVLVSIPPLILLASSSTIAAPVIEKVVSGKASVVKKGQTTTITQGSNKAIINWQSFNIAKSESVKFKQPSVNAVALNRITGGDATQILGKLNANGHVFLVNPNGITIAKGAQINVNGFVASTLSIKDFNFKKGKYLFEGGKTEGVVTNNGKINAHTIVLLGAKVINTGVLTAKINAKDKIGKNGVAMVSASQVEVKLSDRLSVVTQKGIVDALTDNQGSVIADQGTILLSANDLQNKVFPSVVKNSGTLQANSLKKNTKGKISLIANHSKGVIELTGKISAKSAEKSSEVLTKAGKIEISGSAKVETVGKDKNVGNWKISSKGFKIAVKDGDLTGRNLSNHLKNTAIEIQGNGGNIEINDDVSWSTRHLLSLKTSKDIILHNDLTSTAGNPQKKAINKYARAGVELKAENLEFFGDASINLTGSNAVYKYNDKVFQVINGKNDKILGGSALAELQSIRKLTSTKKTSARNFVLGIDINATKTKDWKTTSGVKGFVPIGGASNPYRGSFSGGGHEISNLYIDSISEYVGLFRNAKNATFSDLKLTNININSSSKTAKVGSLLGTGKATINNIRVSGKIIAKGADSITGGIVGQLGKGSLLKNSHSLVDISAKNKAGGLVGLNKGNISFSAFEGQVKGVSQVGGLVGSNQGGSISQSFSRGKVIGTSKVGGLIGESQGGKVSEVYASGEVAASGANVGGLVGKSIKTTYKNSYFTKSTGKTNAPNGVKMLTTENSLAGDSYNNFDIAKVFNGGKVWRIYEGYTTPSLSRFLIKTDVTAETATKSGEYSGKVLTAQLKLNAKKGVEGAYSISTSSADANGYTGTDLKEKSSLYSTLYDIDESKLTSAGSKLTITQKLLTVTGSSAVNKVYDGDRTAQVIKGKLKGEVAGESLGLEAVGTFNNQDVDLANKVSIKYTIVSSGSGKSSNYKINPVIDVAAKITAKTLTVENTTANSKVYDGKNTAKINQGNLKGLVKSEMLGLSATGSFNSQNVAEANGVNVKYSIADNGAFKASNYVLANPTETVDANITPILITVNGITASNKTFDGSTKAVVSSNSLSNILPNDRVNLILKGLFESPEVGNNKKVNVSLSTDNANYRIDNSSVQLSASITSPLDASATSSQRQTDPSGGNNLNLVAVEFDANPFGPTAAGGNLDEIPDQELFEGLLVVKNDGLRRQTGLSEENFECLEANSKEGCKR